MIKSPVILSAARPSCLLRSLGRWLVLPRRRSIGRRALERSMEATCLGGSLPRAPGARSRLRACETGCVVLFFDMTAKSQPLVDSLARRTALRGRLLPTLQVPSLL